ncbi:MAG TPA: sulfite exporter TauE/SafE family protein [Oscillospiraceae bacterium]|nr:sulfite exporter TauE/SafE family protein [Oscillospiraceae bacterium]HPF55063.1 sulfite exporter TauE/SafE family protein [Clostridiales bacterium]HPK34880.1 sulfite exporter TauE/SafE family protein [Oscillospiraceae bacterium]HPR76156.1 sulfite exporter TauE/SafE family protein [Oscillospiraceae bacterium]
MKKLLSWASGAVAGLVAGLFGAGGGIFAVPMLERAGFDQKHAHANCVALVLAVSIPGAILACFREPEILKLALRYVGGTVAGGIVAAIFLAKLPPKLIRISFGILLLLSAIRLAVSA